MELSSVDVSSRVCIGLWRDYFDPHDLDFVMKALSFATLKHQDQTRRNSPFILHPLRVAHIMWNEGVIRDVNQIACALLHHVLDQKAATPEEITQNFNETVSKTLVEFDDEPNFGSGTDEVRLLVIARSTTLSSASQNLKLADMLDRIRHISNRRSGEQKSIAIVWESRLLSAMCKEPKASTPLIHAVSQAIIEALL